jgi:glycosyltransferase involved in cell wall biosynthesis
MPSIIIPTYNYASYLPQAIQSALNQTHQPVEVIVVDDGSTDDTPQVAASFGDAIRYIRQPNAGLSAARNRGIQEATGDLLVFLDADDLLDPTMVEVSLAAWAQLRPQPALVAHVPRRIDEHARPFPDPGLKLAADRDYSQLDLLIKNRFPPTLLASREAILSLGGFDTNFRASEDRDMWVRIARDHRIHCLATSLSSKRCHSSNMSGNWRQQDGGIRLVFEKARRDRALRGLQTIFWLKIWSYHYYQLAMMQATSVPFQALANLARSILLWPLHLDRRHLGQKLLFRLRMAFWILRRTP